MHLFVFATLTVFFFLLAAHFFGIVAAIVPGIEDLFCGVPAVYGSAAVIVNAKYGREVFPLGKVSK
jgi:succinate-acetate transporter protein